jgi:hypothetical protein
LALFDPKGWGALPDQYAIEFKHDFEQAMLKVSSELPYELPILQRAMAAFFFNFQPLPSNLYYKLAKRLYQSQRQISVATLNYERLFEISFTAAGFNLSIGHANSDEIEFNVPHGCCHLFCKSARGDSGAVSFLGLNTQVNGEIEIISDEQEFSHRISNDAFPPIMSYFEPQKRSTVGQIFLTDQRYRFTELVNDAETIIIIGVKIREHDTHIWESIKNANGKLIYCSGKIEKIAFDSWIEKYRTKKENKFINGYWSEKFNDIFNELV